MAWREKMPKFDMTPPYANVEQSGAKQNANDNKTTQPIILNDILWEHIELCKPFFLHH